MFFCFLASFFLHLRFFGIYGVLLSISDFSFKSFLLLFFLKNLHLFFEVSVLNLCLLSYLLHFFLLLLLLNNNWGLEGSADDLAIYHDYLKFLFCLSIENHLIIGMIFKQVILMIEIKTSFIIGKNLLCSNYYFSIHLASLKLTQNEFLSLTEHFLIVDRLYFILAPRAIKKNAVGKVIIARTTTKGNKKCYDMAFHSSAQSMFDIVSY